MRAILSAMGRAALRDFFAAFLILGAGIWTAPNYDAARATVVAASLAGLVAVVRGLRVFVPGLSKALADLIHTPIVYAEVILTAVTTVLVGFIALAEGVLAAPNLEAGKSAAIAGLLAIGTAIWRLAQATLTPGEGPAPLSGIKVPPQPVPPAALPPTLPPDPPFDTP